MDLGLEGKRALVTGSSGGIGAAIARALAAEGVRVAIHGRDVARAEAVAASIREAGGQAATACGDLATDAAADAVAAAATSALGGVDILVNNAGGSTRGKVGSLASDYWLDTYNTNVVTAVRMIDRLHGAMVERKWGRLIQISSLAGVQNGGRSGPYAASKAALNSMALGLSKTLAFTGVTVNTVTPGMIETSMLDSYFLGIGNQMGWGDDRARSVDYVLKNLHKQSVAQLGQPEDIGFVVAMLCSPRSDYINGAVFRVDGGTAASVY